LISYVLPEIEINRDGEPQPAALIAFVMFVIWDAISKMVNLIQRCDNNDAWFTTLLTWERVGIDCF